MKFKYLIIVLCIFTVYSCQKEANLFQEEAVTKENPRAKAFKNAIVFLCTPCPAEPLVVCCSCSS